MKSKTEKVFLIGLVSFTVLYMVWHFGRWYQGNLDRTTTTRDSLITSNTSDPYNSYLLESCLKNQASLK